MSTRCTLTVRDSSGAFTIYRHVDGQPYGHEGVLHSLHNLSEALRPGPQGMGFEPDDLAACIVAAWKQRIGKVRPSHGRDHHGDTDYHYEVTSGAGGIYVEAFKRSRDDQGSTTWESVAETTIRPGEWSRSHP